MRIVKTDCNNVDKVILAQSVKQCVDCVFGNGHSQPLHATTDVHHDHDVLRRCGSLDVPKLSETKRTF